MADKAYATRAQLAAYLGMAAPVDPDLGMERMLLRASELVDEMVRAPYTTDADGLPTDADVAAAMTKATCAVVEAWLEVGETNDVDGLAGRPVSVSGFSGDRAPRYPPRAIVALKAGRLLDVGATRYDEFWREEP